MFDFLKKISKGEKTEKYFGLCLRESGGLGMIIDVFYDRSRIIKKDEMAFKFSNGWEYILEDVDDLLFNLEKRNKEKLDKVLFFLYSHMIDQDTKAIKDPYKKRISQIARELELKPLGFIEYHEAIVRYFAHVEKTPLTAIVLEVDIPTVSIFIYRGGELSFSKNCARTENIIEDLTSLIEEVLDKSILPNRIILYDSNEAIEASSKITNHRWDKDIFVQIPKVEVLNESLLESILMHAVSYQLFSKSQTTYDPLPEQQSPHSNSEDVQDERVEGFVIGEDIAKIKSSDEDMDKDKDVAPDAQDTNTQTHNPEDANSTQGYSAPLSGALPPAADAENNQKISINKIKDSLAPGLKSISNFLKSRGGALLAITMGILLIIVSVFTLLYFFHEASVTVFMDSREIEENAVITAEQGSSQEDGVVNIVPYTDKLTASDSVNTTGKKVIGQKARGKVTIFNSQNSERTFKKGTILTGESKVRFLTLEEVKVASASTSLTSEGNVLTITGKVDVSAEAEELGPEGNISSGKDLTVEDFSSNQYFATVAESFSGGTREEVQTVSRDDMENLEEKLTNKLKAQSSKVEKAAEKGTIVIPDLTELTNQTEKFSHEVGEEASRLSLTMGATVKAYAYEASDLKKVLSSILKDKIPDGFELRSDKISYDLKRVSRRSGRIRLEVEVNAQALPVLDQSAVYADLLGKSQQSMESVLKSKYKIKGYEADIKSPLPILRDRIPIFKKNLTLKVESI